MDCQSIRYAQHAFGRMFERGLSPVSVNGAIENGQVIKSYPNDKPYPSALILGFDDTMPIHVVVAQDPGTGDCIVVTPYRPDPKLWSDDCKTRRAP
jgi:hypothetical protein